MVRSSVFWYLHLVQDLNIIFIIHTCTQDTISLIPQKLCSAKFLQRGFESLNFMAIASDQPEKDGKKVMLVQGIVWLFW